MAGLFDVLTKQYLEKLSVLDFEINRRVSTTMYGGARKSNAKGNSMEFSDFRNYTFGDDLRRIDWNSFARTDKLFMKLFMEERQVAINIFMDTSTSMAAHTDKMLLSQQIVASLAYISLSNSDKVNIYTFNDGVKSSKLNIQSKNSFFETAKFIDGIEYGGKTFIEKTFKETLNIERGISVIITDMFTLDGYQSAIKLLKYKRQEIVLIQVLDKHEVNPSVSGAVRLIDSETGEFKDMEIDSHKINLYKKALLEYQNEIKEFTRKTDVNFKSVNTESDSLKIMAEILQI